MYHSSEDFLAHVAFTGPDEPDDPNIVNHADLRRQFTRWMEHPDVMWAHGWTNWSSRYYPRRVQPEPPFQLYGIVR